MIAALDDPRLPFAIALAVQNSHYRANGLRERTELEAFSDQYVKDARVSIEVVRTAIADTHPKDGDVKQAPLVSGGGARSAIAQPPSEDPSHEQ